jgi:spermidine/putrescine transport system substrate-binding protein
LLKRRKKMRKIGLLVLVLVLFGGMTVSAEELRIYTWSEYMDEEKMPADFEKKFGIKVRLDIYENNEEMVAKLQAGGASQYDIIVPPTTSCRC